jgi:hypothetical protein
MSKSKVLLMLGVVGCLSAPFVHADDTATTDDAVVAGSSDTPDQVANSLPDSASDNAREHAAFGQSVANQARDRGDMTGREFGQSIADQVRQDAASNQHASAGAANASSHGRP